MFAKINMNNASLEENTMFCEMKKVLAEHNSYRNRKNYYPFKMDVFDDIAKEIESSYRQKIADMQHTRYQRENEKKEEIIKAEEEAKINAAVEGLLALSNIDRLVPKKHRLPLNKVRRSSRLAKRPFAFGSYNTLENTTVM